MEHEMICDAVQGVGSVLWITGSRVNKLSNEIETNPLKSFDEISLQFS